MREDDEVSRTCCDRVHQGRSHTRLALALQVAGAVDEHGFRGRAARQFVGFIRAFGGACNNDGVLPGQRFTGQRLDVHGFALVLSEVAFSGGGKCRQGSAGEARLQNIRDFGAEQRLASDQRDPGAARATSCSSQCDAP